MQSEGDRSQPDPLDDETVDLVVEEMTDPRLKETVEMTAMEIEAAREDSAKVPQVSTVDFVTGQAAWISMKSPRKVTENEDSHGLVTIHPKRGLLVIADGLGGHRAGRAASQLAVKVIKKGFPDHRLNTENGHIVISGGLRVPVGRLSKQEEDSQSRQIILERIESANRRLLSNRSGSATTLALAEVSGDRVRTYHVGDSLILVTSQRGRIKHETISHSPVGYAQEAGVFSEVEAIMHEDRHLVSNVVGSRDMSIEIGPWVKLAIRDTVILASDGLFDNLLGYEIVDRIRKGRLEDGVQQLAETAVERMCTANNGLPSKPDDLTILAYRRRK